MVHESSNPEKEDEDRVSLTHANGAQVGVLCRRFSKLVDVGEVLEWNQRAAWKWECLCGVERTLSGRERTAPDPSFSVYRQVQPAETPTSSTYCSQIFISSLFVPGRPAADNPPPPLRIRDGTRRHVPSSQQESPDSARRGLTLQLTAFSLLRHAGASTTQVDGAGFGEEGKKSVTKHQTSASRRGSVSIKAESL